MSRGFAELSESNRIMDEEPQGVFSLTRRNRETMLPHVIAIATALEVCDRVRGFRPLGCSQSASIPSPRSVQSSIICTEPSALALSMPNHHCLRRSQRLLNCRPKASPLRTAMPGRKGKTANNA